MSTLAQSCAALPGATDLAVQDSASTALRKVLAGLRQEFVWVLMVSLVINLALTAPMLYMLQVYDRVIVSQNEFTLLGLTGLLLMALAFMAAAERVRSALLIRVGKRLDLSLSDLLMKQAFVGELMGKRSNLGQIFNDLRMLQQALTGPGMFALFDAPWLPIYLGILYLLHPSLGWISLLFASIQMLASWGTQRVTQKAALEAEANDLKLNDMLFRRLRHVETVEAMGMLAGIRALWIELHGRQRDTAQRYEKLAYRLNLVAALLKQAQPSLILGAGALLAIQGEISLGAMAAAQMLMAKTLQPIDQLVAAWPQLASASHAYTRLSEQIAQRWPIASPWVDMDVQREALPAYAPLVAEGLVIQPPRSARALIGGFSKRFEPGRIHAITGVSGVSKSTLAKQLLGIWPALQADDRSGRSGRPGRPGRDAGSEPGLCAVHWAGVPIPLVDQRGWREKIGYLPQDVVLMEGTIAANIGRMNEDDHEGIAEAAIAAGVHEMILRMPRGYDTAVGEGGGYLSAGQRQRIGLARALYGGPRLLVLDEPNASLDPVGEAALGQALLRAKEQGAIVIVITHRVGVLQFCDEVLELERGH